MADKIDVQGKERAAGARSKSHCFLAMPIRRGTANEHELILKDEVFQIVGAAMEVSNQLGCGFLEAVYQEALGIELDERRIPHVAQKRIEISYKGRVLNKEYIADFLCHDRIVIEIKAIKAITGIEEAQILNYLKATNLPLGLIINFGAPRLEWKRYANTLRNR